jgi:hypothetical protein
MVFNGAFGRGIQNLSETYDHVAIPAGPAFSIWGIIFTWELVFLVAQFFVSDFDDMLPALTPWFCATQLMQGVWVLVFTKTDPGSAGNGGDVFFWISTVLLTATFPAFLQILAALAQTSGTAYWLSFGITINAAWVLLAAGLGLNQAARALGLEGTTLSTVAVVVLIGTVCLELWLTGFIGDNQFNSPLAFFPVAVWALGWVCFHLKSLSVEENPHAKRILPLYGSKFILFYKWSALILAGVFIGLEAVLCTKQVGKAS